MLFCKVTWDHILETDFYLSAVLVTVLLVEIPSGAMSPASLRVNEIDRTLENDVLLFVTPGKQTEKHQRLR